MADRYFQCAMCKKLTILDDDAECYKPSIDNKAVPANLMNEVCNCTSAKRRLRELNQSQYDMEVALDRDINK